MSAKSMNLPYESDQRVIISTIPNDLPPGQGPLTGTAHSRPGTGCRPQSPRQLTGAGASAVARIAFTWKISRHILR